jgi:hypothetical protein
MRNLLPTAPCRTATTRRLGLVATTLAALVLAGLAPGTPAQARSAALGAGNPLEARPWGVDTRHELYHAYDAAIGSTKQLLGTMALQPTVFWFNDVAPVDDITRRLRAYVDDAQDGDPSTLVQMAVFRLWPEGEAQKHKPLSLAERARYRRWIDNAARGIGSARVAMVLEPDLAVALTGWRPAVRLRLARYAAQVFSSLPRTTVYLDAGASDWLSVPKAVDMLRAAGIRYVRGFALGATHYTGTAAEIAYGTELVAALGRAGFRNRHFVIDTADNGRPFTWTQYWDKHPNGDFDNAEECRTRDERQCVTLGIPPTSAVGAAGLGLSPRRRAQAREHVDAYLWFSRPWYVYARPTYFDLERALRVARTTPY